MHADLKQVEKKLNKLIRMMRDLVAVVLGFRGLGCFWLRQQLWV